MGLTTQKRRDFWAISSNLADYGKPHPSIHFVTQDVAFHIHAALRQTQEEPQDAAFHLLIR